MSLKIILALLIGYGILENVPPRPPASLTSSCRGTISQEPQELPSEMDIHGKQTWFTCAGPS